MDAMFGLRAASVSRRSWWAALLALVLALRLVTPAGFMPAFEGGRLSIVECPGSDAAPAMPPMRGMHHDSRKTSQSCPYATATGAGLVDAGPALFSGASFLTVPNSLGRAFVLVARNSAYDRPPAIGPPFPA